MILVVDDQESMCWVLSKVLSEAGFSVKTARTAGEALTMATNNRISAAIVDYRLPDMNGFDLFRELRNRNPKIPGVLITSYGSKEIREEALRLGFYAYFDKPFRNQDLITALQASLEESEGTPARK